MAERPHGTHAKYAVERCRCEPCRLAQRQYNRNRVRAIARPDENWCPYVPADKAREHLAWLADCGVGIKTVAKLSGVPHGSLSKVVYGQGGRAPSRRIRPETERRILAVMPHHAAGAQKIPAAHTWRLLNDLIARGWTRAELARRLGTQGPGLQIGRHQVRASTARKVERLHTELSRLPAIPRRTRWGSSFVPARRVS
jgi:hypothetical protein